MKISFRTLYGLAILVVVIVIGITTVLFIGYQNEKILNSDINLKAEQILDYTHETTNLYLTTATATLQDLSDDADIISLLKNNDKSSFNTVNEKLTSIPLFEKKFNNLAVYDNNCILRGASSASLSLVGKSFSDRDYCKGIKKTGQVYISGALWGVVSKKPIITVSVPVKNEQGEMTGFVFGSINLEYLSDSIRNLQKGDDSIVILDRSGAVFLDTGKNIAQIVPAENETQKDINAVTQKLQAGEDKGFFKFTEDNGRVDHVAYKNYVYATIILDRPYANLIGIINQTNITLIIALIVALIIALIASWIISGIVLNPIKKLKEQVDEISKGKLDIQLGKSNITEIWNLTDSLNRILATLKLAILRTGLSKAELGFGEAIKAKEEAEDRYKLLYETSNDAIMTVEPPNWKFTAGNPAALRIYGVKSEEEFRKLGPWDVSPEKQPDGSDSAKKAQQMIMKAMKEGSAFFEWTHRKYKGESFPATILLTRFKLNGKDVVQATVRDLSESGREEIEEKYKLLTEESTDVIYKMDLKQNFTYVSPSVERFTGYKPEEVMKIGLKKLLTPESYRKQYRGMLKSLLFRDYEPKVLQVEFIRKNGERAIGELHAKFLFDKNKKVIGFMGVARDISKIDLLKDREEIMEKRETISKSREKIVGKREKTATGREKMVGKEKK